MVVDQPKQVEFGQNIFKTESGNELIRLATIKAKLKLEQDGIKLNERANVAKFLGLSPREPIDKFLRAVQDKIDAIKRQIYQEVMIVEERGDGEILVKSCDRSALVLIHQEKNDRLMSFVFYYDDKNRSSDAKPKTEHLDEASAFDAAQEWVLELR